jgi:hypothetical protein
MTDFARGRCWGQLRESRPVGRTVWVSHESRSGCFGGSGKVCVCLILLLYDLVAAVFCHEVDQDSERRIGRVMRVEWEENWLLDDGNDVAVRRL